VPHVHPFANGALALYSYSYSNYWLNLGTVSGIVGASGNLGGIIFSIIFRYGGVQYHRSIWIIGVICICVSLSVSWIRPIPRGQIGGVWREIIEKKFFWKVDEAILVYAQYIIITN
jgi:NNP family nitrate/nitrite transporter-like MFS transporter